MTADLSGRRIAILIAPVGTEEREFTEPRATLEGAGATTVVVGTEPGRAHTRNHDLDPGGTYGVDVTVDAISPDDFDAVVIPGGTVGADNLRSNADVIDFVRAMAAGGKPVASICHGPWTLIEAGIAEGRRLTSYPSLQTDLRNAGADWVDEEVVEDRGVITSRRPGDLPVFCSTLVAAMARTTVPTRG